MSVRVVKPDTAISAALAAAGHKPAAERLDDAVMAAAAKHPEDRRAAIQAFLDAIQSKADLLWELMGDRRSLLAAQRFDATMTALRELEEERQREEAAKRQKTTNGSSDGRCQEPRATQKAPAPAVGARAAFGAYGRRTPPVPTDHAQRAKRQGERLRGVSRFERESLIYSYTIRKRPIAEYTVGFVKTYTRAKAVELRWFALLTAGATSATQKIHEVVNPGDPERFWAQAKREIAEQEAA